MDFVLKRANYASFDTAFQKEIEVIAKRRAKVIKVDLDFIEKIEELGLNEADEPVAEQRKDFENLLKENMKTFLICHQLYRKFGFEFYQLDTSTLKFAIIFERNISKSFVKEIEKLIFLECKVKVVISNTYL